MVLVLFELYDLDGDGYISAQDLQIWIAIMVGDSYSEKLRSQSCYRTVADADRDCDGKLSYQDFKQVLFWIFKFLNI